MRGALALCAAALLCAGTQSASAQLRCPAELTVNEQPVAPPGMRGDGAQRTRVLARVTVFDGMPSEKTELRARRAGDSLVFDLPSPRQRPSILVCRYADTPVTLSAPIPAAVARCTVRGAAGARTRQQVECR